MRAGCPDWVALLTILMLDLVIKFHLPNALSIQDQFGRRLPTIEITLGFYLG